MWDLLENDDEYEPATKAAKIFPVVFFLEQASNLAHKTN